MDQLRVQIIKVFKIAVPLFFFAAHINKNCDWFALSLLFEKEVFLCSDSDGFEDGSGSHKDSGSGENEVEFGVKERCIYKKDKELLWKCNMYIYSQFLM